MATAIGTGTNLCRCWQQLFIFGIQYVCAICMCNIHKQVLSEPPLPQTQPIISRTNINIKGPRDSSPGSSPDPLCLFPTHWTLSCHIYLSIQSDPAHPLLALAQWDCLIIPFLNPPHHLDLMGVKYPVPSLVWLPLTAHHNWLLGFYLLLAQRILPHHIQPPDLRRSYTFFWIYPGEAVWSSLPDILPCSQIYPLYSMLDQSTHLSHQPSPLCPWLYSN